LACPDSLAAVARLITKLPLRPIGESAVGNGAFGLGIICAPQDLSHRTLTGLARARRRLHDRTCTLLLLSSVAGTPVTPFSKRAILWPCRIRARTGSRVARTRLSKSARAEPSAIQGVFFDGSQPTPFTAAALLGARTPLHPLRHLAVLADLHHVSSTVLSLHQRTFAFSTASSCHAENRPISLPLERHDCIARRPSAPVAQEAVLGRILANSLTVLRISQGALASWSAALVVLGNLAGPCAEADAALRSRPSLPITKHAGCRCFVCRAVGVLCRTVGLVWASMVLNLLSSADLLAEILAVAALRATHRPGIQHVTMNDSSSSQSRQSSDGRWPRHGLSLSREHEAGPLCPFYACSSGQRSRQA